MLATYGPLISKVPTSSAVPAMTGGTIADGTYVLSRVIVYDSTSVGSTRQRVTFKFAGSEVESVSYSDNNPDDTGSLSATASISGSTLNLHIYCPPDGGLWPIPYGVSGGEILMQLNGGNLDEVYYFDPLDGG